MRRSILALCLITFYITGFSQDSRIFEFQGSVLDKSDGKPLSGYIVDVYEGNIIYQSPIPTKKGRFIAELYGSNSYTIDIYLNGYYPKRVVVNTDVPIDVKKIPALKFEVELIRKSDYELIEKVDPFATSIFDFPYVIFEWKKNLDDFGYREAYTEHIKQKYAEVSDLR